MPYDDEDLFGEDFDFVDDEDDDVAPRSSAEDTTEEEKPAPKPRRRAPAKGKEKPASERPRGRAKGAPAPAARRAEPPAVEHDATPEPPVVERDDEPVIDVEDEEAPAPVSTGPPADHAVHIYEHGRFKRTIPRKFTDEEAVSFAEEYTRTGKAYGRYAVATPEDEEPSSTFAGASKGG